MKIEYPDPVAPKVALACSSWDLHWPALPFISFSILYASVPDTMACSRA